MYNSGFDTLSALISLLMEGVNWLYHIFITTVHTKLDKLIKLEVLATLRHLMQGSETQKS
jgi:hypothetical protein